MGIPTPLPGAGIPGGTGAGVPGGMPPGAGLPGGTAPGGMPGAGDSPTGAPTANDPGGATASLPGGAGAPNSAGSYPGGAGPAAPPGGASGDGPLTPAEQVAILDAELERGTGDFDDMILDTQQEQREKQRESAHSGPDNPASGDTPAADGDTQTPPPPAYEPVADAGSASRRDAPPGGNAPIYAPPEDIPSGDDDDLVARQLRELAMSEPDPAVRERLWEEYRKYKGIKP